MILLSEVMNCWPQHSDTMEVRDSKMLARMWLKLLTMGSKLGEKKVKPREMWEGREAEWDWKIHRTDSWCEKWKNQRQTSESEIFLRQQFLAVAISGLWAWEGTDA